MSLLFDPRKLCRIEYNIQRGAALKDSDFVFSNPVDLRDFVGQRPDGKNTMLVATVAGKKVNYFYNRIDPTVNFFEQFGPQSVAASNVWRLVLEKDSVGSTKKLARPLARCFGLPITEDDIAAEPFTPPTIADQTVTITFGKDGLLFLPGAKLTVAIEGTYRVADGKAYYVTDFNRNPDMFYEDHVLRNRTASTWLRAATLTYGNDYTPAAAWLKRIVGSSNWVASEVLGAQADSTAFLNSLAQVLGQVDGLPWAMPGATAGAYNLSNAWCFYNGPVSGAKEVFKSLGTWLPPHLLRTLELGNPAFDNVALLFNSTYNNNTTLLASVFHYNNP